MSEGEEFNKLFGGNNVCHRVNWKKTVAERCAPVGIPKGTDLTIATKIKTCPSIPSASRRGQELQEIPEDSQVH